MSTEGLEGMGGRAMEVVEEEEVVIMVVGGVDMVEGGEEEEGVEVITWAGGVGDLVTVCLAGSEILVATVVVVVVVVGLGTEITDSEAKS